MVVGQPPAPEALVRSPPQPVADPHKPDQRLLGDARRNFYSHRHTCGIVHVYRHIVNQETIVQQTKPFSLMIKANKPRICYKIRLWIFPTDRKRKLSATEKIFEV